MEQILLNGITVEQLLQRIDVLFDQKLKGQDQLTSRNSEFLSRNEVAKLLKITLPTLNEWTKLGWLKSYKIGNRVLYKLAEIEEAVSKVSSFKYKKLPYAPQK